MTQRIALLLKVRSWLDTQRTANAAAQTPARPVPARPAAAREATPTTPVAGTVTPAAGTTIPTNQRPPQAGTPNPGAPTPTTPGAQIVRTVDRNGNSVYSNAGDPNAPAYNAQPAALGGTVNQQSFGTAPTINRNIGGRQVASTFGMSALDPRLNEANQPTRGQNVGFRGVDAMIDYNANQDAVAAQKKMLGDLDTEAFRLSMRANNSGSSGRAAAAALANVRAQQAGIVNAMAGTSAGAVQGREERDNRFGIAGMEQQGQNYRTLLDADSRSQIAGMQDATTREGLRLGHEAAMAQVNKPQYITDDQNRYRMLSNGTGTLVVGEDGKPITAATQRNDQQMAEALLKSYTDRATAIATGTGTEEQKAAAQAALDAEPMYASLLGRGQGGQLPRVSTKADLDRLPSGTVYIAPDGSTQRKK